ncbi:MAG: uracil-DNA glycosylase family protein [Paracoccaceae bacterium]
MDGIRQRIENAADQFGYSLGWRLLYSPIDVIRGARVAFLGLNPGGDSPEPHRDGIARPSGSAYVEEEWKGFRPGMAPLQKQVLALFEKLRVAPERVLAGNIVPFRSPDWKSLPHKDHALRLGYEVWRQLLVAAKPELVIAMGSDAHEPVLKLTGASAVRSVPLGWGNVRVVAADAPGLRVVTLPHLSRYRVVDRAESQSALAQAFGASWHQP